MSDFRLAAPALPNPLVKYYYYELLIILLNELLLNYIVKLMAIPYKLGWDGSPVIRVWDKNKTFDNTMSCLVRLDVYGKSKDVKMPLDMALSFNTFLHL
jgi:hypothetical protein